MTHGNFHYDTTYLLRSISARRASINYVSRRGGGGVSQMLMLLHKLVVNLLTEGGGGQKLTKYCSRSLWMPPSSISETNRKFVCVNFGYFLTACNRNFILAFLKQTTFKYIKMAGEIVQFNLNLVSFKIYFYSYKTFV